MFWLADYLQDYCKGSTLYGFRGGPAGIMKCKYVVLTPEYIYPYRNQVKHAPFFLDPLGTVMLLSIQFSSSLLVLILILEKCKLAN